MRCVRPLLALVALLVGATLPGLGPSVAAAAQGGESRSAGPPGASEPAAEARRAAAVELSGLATRIEALKRDVAAGRARQGELQPLLARAQELAAFLERTDPDRPPRGGPRGLDPQELRERADAVRDRADRLAATLAQLEERLKEARRRADLDARLQAVGGAGDLFAESSPRRVQASRGGLSAEASRTGAPGTGTPAPGAPAGDAAGGAAGASAGSPTSAPVSAPSAGPATQGSSPFTASPAGTAASAQAPDAAARALASPRLRDGDALAPGAADSIADLQRKRGQARTALQALRAEADALEAEAKAAEKMR